VKSGCARRVPSVSTSPTRAAIYVRVSLDHTGEGKAVERQLEECERIVAERGWTLHRVYRDNNLSASKRDGVRPAYNEMERDFEAGAFDALVCWDLDRLTRQPRQLEDWIDAAVYRHLRLVTANGEADLANDAGRMFARIKATVARAEMERKSARQKAANAQRRSEGIPSSGRVPFGYSWVGAAERRRRGSNAAYDIVEHEAAVVRDMYASLIAGVPLGSIAREMNTAGRLTRAGAQWQPSTVKRLLLSPFNAGLIPPRRDTDEHYTPANVDPDLCTKGEWTGIVEVGTWRAARELLSARRPHGQGTARKWLLSGLAVCGVCFEPIRSGGGDKGVQSYRCRSMGHFMRRGAPLDAFVASLVVDRLSRPDAADLLLDRDRPDLDALRAERAGVSARLGRVAALVADGTFTPEDARTAMRGLREELASLDAQMTEVSRVEVLGDVVSAADVAAVWASLSLDRKRAIVDMLMRVEVHTIGQGNRTGGDLNDPAVYRRVMARMAETTSITWKV